MDTFPTLPERIGSFVALIPVSLVTAIMLAVAALIGMGVFWLVDRLTWRLLATRSPNLFSFLHRTKGVVRFTLVLLAMAITAHNVPLAPEAADVLRRIFQVGFIVMLGWLAIVGTQMAADVYLLRFRIDVEDNLLARKHVTQVRIFKGALQTLIVVVTTAAALMSFDIVRQFGLSLLASAGFASIIVGLAARPLLSNLIAGMQLAMTQPIRIDDAVVVENEWGWIEEITSTYVVIKLWDWRRLIVPLSYFMEKPFQNWTHESASLIGTIFLYVDYTVPVEDVRQALYRFARESRLWDRQVVNLQVTDSKSNVIELRALVSGRNSSDVFDLRCEIRERLIDYLQSKHPQALPRAREELFPHGAPQLAPLHGDISRQPAAAKS